ncbi:MAG: DUF255 domain-containing protein [Verrucomicrobiales bacterium]
MRSPTHLLPIFAVPLFFTACGKKESASSSAVAPVIPAELQSNQLLDAPSSFLEDSAQAPVNWQHWTPAVLDQAKQSQRPVFALIVSSRYQGCYEILEAIHAKHSLVKRLNEQFVPVLADLDVSRETSLLASNLSREAGTPLGFPFILVLSPEGSPITSHPLNYTDPRDLLEFFDNSLEVVNRLWTEDPEILMSDSALKVELRGEHLPKPDPVVSDPDERKARYQKAIRRIISFYDSDLESMAGTGGLLPLGLLHTLHISSLNPELPANLRDDCGTIVESVLDELLTGAMIDPLDGGAYSVRRAHSWNYPIFLRDCATQAELVRLMALVHRTHPNPTLLNKALGVIDFAETRYLTHSGLFSLVGLPSATPRREWMWTTKQLGETLNQDELAVWKEISEIEALGNLPREASTSGQLFRLNTLRFAHSPATVAAKLDLPVSKAQELLESGRKKLLKAREARFPTRRVGSIPSATASFRMASAYASLYLATGDQSWKTKAESLATLSRQSFELDGFLNESPASESSTVSDGRAFVYMVGAQAAFDVAAVTLNDEWNLWARDLLSQVGEHFVRNDICLVETREATEVVPILVEDRYMVFGNSTTGQLRINLGRLESIGLKTPPSLRPWNESLPDIARSPIIHTDVILALALEQTRSPITLGPGLTADLEAAVAQLPLELFPRRRFATHEPRVKVTSPGQEPTILQTPEAIQALAPTSN